MLLFDVTPLVKPRFHPFLQHAWVWSYGTYVSIQCRTSRDDQDCLESSKHFAVVRLATSKLPAIKYFYFCSPAVKAIWLMQYFFPLVGFTKLSGDSIELCGFTKHVILYTSAEQETINRLSKWCRDNSSCTLKKSFADIYCNITSPTVFFSMILVFTLNASQNADLSASPWERTCVIIYRNGSRPWQYT